MTDHESDAEAGAMQVRRRAPITRARGASPSAGTTPLDSTLE